MVHDPAEVRLQWLALFLTASFSLLLMVERYAAPLRAGSATHPTQVTLSVIVAPPAPVSTPQRRIEKQTVKARPRATIHRAASRVPRPAVSPPAQAVSAPAVAASLPEPASAAPYDPDAAYIASLRTNIAGRTVPPDAPEFRLLHPSGIAVVQFTLDRAGGVSGVTLVRSSSSAMLDRQAETIVASGTYPRMPTDVYRGEASHVFDISIEFRRERGTPL